MAILSYFTRVPLDIEVSSSALSAKKKYMGVSVAKRHRISSDPKCQNIGVFWTPYSNNIEKADM